MARRPLAPSESRSSAGRSVRRPDALTVSGATVLDGKLDAGSVTVKAMQRSLNEGSF